jgi:hypothetical protein
LLYGTFIVAINGLFRYQQETLLTDGKAICRKAGPAGAVTPTKIEEMETQIHEAFEKRYEKIPMQRCLEGETAGQLRII